MMRAGARVLLVEDRAVVRLALVQALREAGFMVEAMSPRGLAAEPARRRQQAVVVVGLHRPRLEGLVNVRRILDEAAGQPVVVMASPDALDAALELRHHGPVDVLVKPCARAALVAAVRRAEAAEALRRLPPAPSPATSRAKVDGAGAFPVARPRDALGALAATA